MGFLFKKPKLKEKDEDNPVWKELRTFREEQKRKVSGEPQKRDIPSRKAEDGSNEPVLPPIEPLKFRCTSCGTVYPESWNRCPKCGGEVVPVKPEGKLEEKNLDVLPPGQKMPSPSSAELMAPVKTVKKVKEIKKKT
ncbi:MAG TPA: hypothetical protein EYP29_03800, partial [Thermoplasmata archaeon]|nr:hypothetical protein [Thermoplasmata archaeon]